MAFAPKLSGLSRRIGVAHLFLAVVVGELHALEIVFHGWPDLAFQLKTVGAWVPSGLSDLFGT